MSPRHIHYVCSIFLIGFEDLKVFFSPSPFSFPSFISKCLAFALGTKFCLLMDWLAYWHKNGQQNRGTGQGPFLIPRGSWGEFSGHQVNPFPSPQSCVVCLLSLASPSPNTNPSNKHVIAAVSHFTQRSWVVPSFPLIKGGICQNHKTLQSFYCKIHPQAISGFAWGERP